MSGGGGRTASPRFQGHKATVVICWEHSKLKCIYDFLFLSGCRLSKNYEVSFANKEVGNEVYCGLFVTKLFLSQTKFVFYSPSFITLHYVFLMSLSPEKLSFFKGGQNTMKNS